MNHIKKHYVVTSWAETPGGSVRPEWREDTKSSKDAWKIVDDSGADRVRVRRTVSADGRIVFMDIYPERWMAV